MRGAEVLKSHPNRIWLATFAVSLLAVPAVAQITQQAGPLVSTHGVAAPQQGNAVAVSVDGNTAIVGASGDNTNIGAAFVWFRNNGVWGEQQKLVGAGYTGPLVSQGQSVAISSDGNTALVGGANDNTNVGGVWVFTRSGATWSQLTKLAPTGMTGPASLGASVALAADASVAVIGGPSDNGLAGAVWVFTQDLTSHAWTQRAKLVCAGATATAGCGSAVAITPDGDTIVAGGYRDNSFAGAVWFFKRPGPTFSCTSQCGTIHAVIVSDPRINVWTQQGNKISGPAGSTLGLSVAISGNGLTAVVGAPHANLIPSDAGATYVYPITPANPVPTPAANAQLTVQTPAVVVGAGVAGGVAGQGMSVGITTDGNSIFVGGPYDNGSVGAVWEFARNSSPAPAPPWTQVGSKLVGATNIGASFQGASVGVSGNAHVVAVGGPNDHFVAGTGRLGAAWIFGLAPAPDLVAAFDPNHSVTLHRGDTGAVYYWEIQNQGDGPSSGQVKVVFTVPYGLSAASLSGTNWACNLGTLTCTRNDVLATGQPYADEILLTVDVNANAPSSLEVDATVSGGSEPAYNNGNNVGKFFSTLPAVSDMTVKMSHTASFYPGQTGAKYTVRVHNAGMAAATGPVVVSAVMVAALTLTGVSGAGWSCGMGGGGWFCTRSDSLAPGGTYPAIVVTVNVSAGASGTLFSNVTVSRADDLDPSNNAFTDPTLIGSGSDLVIAVNHAGTLTHGQTNAVYEITVTNNGSVATAGKVTVTDTLPAGFTATAMSGTGWLCASWSQTCVRTDALPSGASYPTIRLTVTIGAGAASSVTNSVAVSGGGDANTGNNGASDTSGVS